MGAVAGVIGRIPGVGHGVDPMKVIDQPVAVVVELVAGNLIRVDPEVGGQIFMGLADSRVDDRYDNVAGGVESIPRFGGIDVRIGDTAGLSRVVQVPLPPVGKGRVVWRGRRIYPGVKRRRLDMAALLIACDDLRRRGAAGQFQDVNVGCVGECFKNPGARCGV